MDRTLVIIPTYNERENAGPIASAVLENVPEADILFVDDNSPDGTGEILDGLAASNPHVNVMHRPGKAGLGKAYIAGFKWGLERDYELLVEMDADFSHDPKALPSLIAAASEADLVLGSRYIGGIRVMNWPLGRLLISTGAGVYVRMITGMPVCDPTGGFKCFHRRVLESIALDKVTSSGYSFQIEMTHSAWMKGFSVKEVPIIFEDRKAGVSKMSLGIAREALYMVWALWFRSGLRRSPRKKKPEDAKA